MTCHRTVCLLAAPLRLWVVLVICLGLFWVCPAALAGEKVRVGYFPMTSFQEMDAYGQFSGYQYDFIQEISRYTGWECEFVRGSFDESLRRLQRGEIDLLGGLWRTPEREKALHFPLTPQGTGYVALFVRREDARFQAEDDAFDGMRVGVVRGSGQPDLLRRHAGEKGFAPRIVLFDTYDAMLEALEKGTLDALMSMEFRADARLRVATRFAPLPFFLAVARGREDLLRQLDEAQSRLRVENPQFEMHLQARYAGLEASQRMGLSRREREALRAHPRLRVVYLRQLRPLSWQRDTGEFAGALADIFDVLSRKSGIAFDYIPVDSHEEGIRKIRIGEADLLSLFSDNARLADSLCLRLSPVYLNIPVALVVRKDYTLRPGGMLAVPRRSDYRIYQQLIKEFGANPLFLDSPWTSFEYVRSGVAQLAFSNIYTVNYLLSQRRFSTLSLASVTDLTDNLCFVASEDCDATLFSALGKIMASLSSTEKNMLIVANAAVRDESVMDVFYEYPVEIFILFVTIALSVIIVLWKKNATIKALLYRDQLTGLCNHRGFLRRADELLRRSGGLSCALLYIDVNRLKYINAALGYDAGDRLLLRLADVLRDFVGKGECVGKIAADHFLVLLVFEDREALTRRLERLDVLRAGIQQAARLPFAVALRCGIYILPPDVSLVTAIDRAHYAKDFARSSYQSVYTWYDEKIIRQLQEEKEIEDAMEDALREGQFVPWFQPKVVMDSGAIVGAEALTRWEHPEKGLLQPARFVPLFERNGFIRQVDLHMFERVCRFQAALLARGARPVPISSNFSRNHFFSGDLPRILDDCAQRHGVPRQLLEVEITETTAVQDISVIQGQIARLRDMGFRVAIDDFGSGYSSIGMLCNLKVDTLKLDKVFLAGSAGNGSGMYFIEAVVEIARRLHVDVVCEGVETAEQAAFLKRIGCADAQGYFFFRPLPEEEFLRCLTSREK